MIHKCGFLPIIAFYIFISVLFVRTYCSEHIDEFLEELSAPLGSMQYFDGGHFLMGIHEPESEHTGEHPIRTEYTKPFEMDRYPVTNGEFAEFVNATHYRRTGADINFYSYVFFTHLSPGSRQMVDALLPNEPWWVPVVHARWDRPFGYASNNDGRRDHPVVHVSVSDAIAYCKYKKKRLPTEFEWEYAARGNNNTWTYPWGEGYRRNRMNTWEGIFPAENKGYDGHQGISPVRAYPPQNAHSMYDMLGNVWEWTTTKYYAKDHGDTRGQDTNKWVVLKGGSFVDSLERGGVNRIVRCSVKKGRSPDFTAENIGFRCARSYVPPPPPPPPIIRYEDTWHYRQQKKQMENKYRQLQKNIDNLKFSSDEL